VYAEGIARVSDVLAFDTDGNFYATTHAANCIYRIAPKRRVELLCEDGENL